MTQLNRRRGLIVALLISIAINLFWSAASLIDSI